jgi:hypothetical protein
MRILPGMRGLRDAGGRCDHTNQRGPFGLAGEDGQCMPGQWKEDPESTNQD